MNTLSPETLAALRARGIDPANPNGLPPAAPPPPTPAYSPAPAPPPPPASSAPWPPPMPPPPPQGGDPTAGKTEQQIWDLQHKGLISFQEAKAAEKHAVQLGAPADNSADQAALAQAHAANRGPEMTRQFGGGAPPAPVEAKPAAGGDWVGAPQATAPQAPTTFGLPQGTGPQVIGAHEGRAVSQGAERKFDAAGNEMRDAAAAQGAAEVGANEHLSDDSRRTAVKLAEQDVDRRQWEREQQHKLDYQKGEADRMRHEADVGEPNYERWWGSRSAGQKALAIIGQALGAFGGGENQAAKIIRGFMDDDIRQQEASLKKKQTGAQMADGSYGRALDTFKDAQAAKLSEQGRQLEAFKIGLASEAQRAQSPILKARAQSVIATLDQQQAEIYAKLHPYVQAQTAGGGASKAISEAALKIYTDSKGAVPMEQAMRQATYAFTGRDPLGAASQPAGWDKKPEGANLDGLKAPPSTNFMEHPLDYVTGALGIQGTDGASKVMDQQAYDSQISGLVHKAFGARTPAAQEHIGRSFMAGRNDSTATLEHRLRNARRILGGVHDDGKGPIPDFTKEPLTGDE